jgi:hypothetical protein
MGKKSIVLILFFSMLIGLSGCINDPGVLPSNELPVFNGPDTFDLNIYDDAPDWLSLVTVYDQEDGNLTSEISVESDVVLHQIGDYSVTYSVEDEDGNYVTHEIAVFIRDLQAVYPNGVYDYSLLDSQSKEAFVGAAERYLLETMMGGIPMFDFVTYQVYSDRVESLTPYIVELEFSQEFASLNTDDSSVLMYDSSYGNSGEYTFRSYTYENIQTYIAMTSSRSSDLEIMQYVYEPFYRRVPNADENGYTFLPALAESLPVIVDDPTNPNGTTFELTIKDDLKWYFHPDTDPDFLDTNPNTYITAQDFVDSISIGLENYFVHVYDEYDFSLPYNGGSLFGLDGVSENVGVDRELQDIGLYVKEGDDNTIVFEFNYDMSLYSFINRLSYVTLAPLNSQMYDYYESLVEDGIESYNLYGTSNTSVAYSGPYYVKEELEDEVIILEENPDYNGTDLYHYTGLQFLVIDNADAFDYYEAGYLDVSYFNRTYYEDYKDTNLLHSIPSTTGMRLVYNASGTIEANQEYHPDSDYSPEPILSSVSFLKALDYSIDLNTLASDIIDDGSLAKNHLFTDLFILNSENGIPYNKTQTALDNQDLYRDYDTSMAASLFHQAIEEMIEAGYYEGIDQATSDNPYVITINLLVYDESDLWQDIGMYLEEGWESVLIDEDFHVVIDIEVEYVTYPAYLFDHLLVGEFDLGFSGLEVSSSDIAASLNDYSNQDAFNTCVGFDSTSALIEVVYQKEGTYVKELWSYDAIVSFMNPNKITVLEDGELASEPELEITNVTPRSFEISLIEGTSNQYENMQYTIFEYNLDLDRYVIYEAYNKLSFTNNLVEITGLSPHQIIHNENGEFVFSGDYKVVLTYQSAMDSNVTFEKTYIMNTQSILDINFVGINSFTEFEFSVVENDPNYFTIDTIELFESIDGSYSDITQTVSIENGESLLISPINESTTYLLKFTFDDGSIMYYRFRENVY